MKNEEKRFVVTDEQVPREKKKWMANMPMVTIQDTKSGASFAAQVKSAEKIVGDRIKKISYACLPDGAAVVLNIVDMGEAKKADTIEVGQVIRNIGMSPYIYL